MMKLRRTSANRTWPETIVTLTRISDRSDFVRLIRKYPRSLILMYHPHKAVVRTKLSSARSCHPHEAVIGTQPGGTPRMKGLVVDDPGTNSWRLQRQASLRETACDFSASFGDGCVLRCCATQSSARSGIPCCSASSLLLFHALPGMRVMKVENTRRKASLAALSSNFLASSAESNGRTSARNAGSSSLANMRSWACAREIVCCEARRY
jgi:hypothetical protein